MIVGLPLFVMLAAPVLLVVMLLPTLLEMKKPKDAGPRQIMSELSPVLSESTLKPSPLACVDEKSGIGSKTGATDQKRAEYSTSL